MGNELTIKDNLSVNAVQELASSIRASNLLPRSLRNEADALVVILTGQELGLTPMASLRCLHVVEGRATLSADVMMGLCLAHPQCEYFACEESTRERAVFVAKRRGAPEPTRYEFTEGDAKAAGLLNRKGPWQQYRKAMLAARCKAALARLVFPDILSGIYDSDSGEIAPPRYSQPVDNTVGNDNADVIDAEVVESGPTQKEAVSRLIDVLTECFESNPSELDVWLQINKRPSVAEKAPAEVAAFADWLAGEKGQALYGKWLNLRDAEVGGWAVRELCRAGYDEGAALKIARGTADKHDRREFLHHIRSHHLRQAMRMASPEAVRGWIAANMPDVATGNLEKAIQAVSLRCELNAVTLAEQVSQFETEGGDE